MTSPANVVLVASGRGGVGKTSIAANLAGLAASTGWRVLAVDLDPHATLGRDLGWSDRDDHDHGAGLLRAVLGEAESLEPLRGVRANLDLVAAGSYTRELAMAMNTAVDEGVLLGLRRAIGSLAGDYDLVVLDAPPPPAHKVIDAAMLAARYVIAPSVVDRTALLGLLRTVDMVRVAQRSDNPHLRLLGIVFFAVEAEEPHAVASSHRMVVDAADCPLPAYSSVIRSNPRVADACRSLGLLAHEYHYASVELGDLTDDSRIVADEYRSLAREVLSDLREQVELAFTSAASSVSLQSALGEVPAA